MHAFLGSFMRMGVYFLAPSHVSADYSLARDSSSIVVAASRATVSSLGVWCVSIPIVKLLLLWEIFLALHFFGRGLGMQRGQPLRLHERIT